MKYYKIGKICKIIRFFRKSTGLFYHIVDEAKVGDIVTLEDDFFGYDAFGVLKYEKGKLIIHMGHKYFEIDEEIKGNISGGVERFYFKGIKI